MSWISVESFSQIPLPQQDTNLTQHKPDALTRIYTPRWKYRLGGGFMVLNGRSTFFFLFFFDEGRSTFNFRASINSNMNI